MAQNPRVPRVSPQIGHLVFKSFFLFLKKIFFLDGKLFIFILQNNLRLRFHNVQD